MDYKEKMRRRTVGLVLLGIIPNRKNCEVCSSNAEIHHIDYSTPFFVIFLCSRHHGEVHRKIKDAYLFEKFVDRQGISHAVAEDIMYSLFFDRRFQTASGKPRYGLLSRHYNTTWNLQISERSLKYFYQQLVLFKRYIIDILEKKHFGSWTSYYKKKV